MKNQILFGILFFVFAGCKTQQSKVEVKDTAIEPNAVPYFKASGNEPFWSLQISDTEIQIQSMASSFETFTVPYIAPVKAMDANVKMYQVSTEKGDFNIQIEFVDCQDSMSGVLSPYSVTIEAKPRTDPKLITLSGCGKYVTDYRLHDIWVLEQLNGRKVSLSDFGKELPLIEINSETNTFMGFAGCNQMNGRLFYEKGLLRFSNITTTLMACGPKNKEGEFLKALQSTITYEIKDNRLWLSNPSGLLIVFKKID